MRLYYDTPRHRGTELDWVPFAKNIKRSYLILIHTFVLINVLIMTIRSKFNHPCKNFTKQKKKKIASQNYNVMLVGNLNNSND